MHPSLRFLYLLVALAFPAHAEQGPLAAVLQPFVDHHTVAGAVVLVASRDKVLDIETVGYADLEARKPMAQDSLFWIASMTKAMTCTAMMMLIDEGKACLDDPVEKYLPEFKGQMYITEKDDAHMLLKKPPHPFTIRQLMSHTSGMGIAAPMDRPSYDMAPLVQRIPEYAALPLAAEPGTKFLYTNEGMSTVGRLIEVISGHAYEQFMIERLFRPLGMTDTTFRPSAEQLQRLAKSYKINAVKGGLQASLIGMLNRDLTNPQRMAWPGGGLFSTATDVAKFCQMFLNNGADENGKRILSEASVQAMTQKQTGDAVKESYGFGWNANGTVFVHSGAYRTEMRVNKEKGIITVFLVQVDGEWPNNGKEITPAFLKAAEAFAPAAR
ncbi:MAG: estB 3 [Verrucomicrobiaceae bacterium]|nr:estB 3 [Verrucomicrobiaceae bacterium]